MLLFALSIINTPEDRSRLTEIYDRFFLKMYNYALSCLKTKSEAEDAVQETFLALARNIDKIDDPASLKTKGYVMTTLKTKIIDIKRRTIRDYVFIENADTYSEEFDDSVFDTIADLEQKEPLRQAVKSLKGSERQILLWRLYDEMSFEEIAKLTGMSEGNVKNIYYRTLKKLKKMLGVESNE